MNSLKLINIGQLVTYDSMKNEMVVFENTEIAIEGNHIKEVGQNLGDADQIFDCKNKLVTPGFVDPHTHPVFLNGPWEVNIMKDIIYIRDLRVQAIIGIFGWERK